MQVPDDLLTNRLRPKPPRRCNTGPIHTHTHTPQSRTIAVKYHWFREQLSKDTIRVEKIDGKLQRANILTKALPRAQFKSKWKMLIGW